MKLSAFVNEVISELRAGAKSGQALVVDAVEIEVGLDADGEVCDAYQEPKATVCFSISLQQ